MTDPPVGELVIFRFLPISAAKLAEQARAEVDELRQKGKAPIYSISTYGLVREHPGATVDDLIYRICEQAPINGKHVCVTTKATLEANGFPVQLSEPPKNHYNVVFGTVLRAEDTERLQGLFAEGRRRNPAWVK